MSETATPSLPLAPSERLRVCLALTCNGGGIVLEREFATQLLRENAEIRNATAGRMVDEVMAEARPILDQARAVLRRVRREAAVAVGVWGLNIAILLLNLWLAGWFG